MTGDEGFGTRNGNPSERVIRRVAELEDVDPTALRQPLDDAVDTDALDKLFADQLDGSPRTTGFVRFDYYDYTVTVEADGSISIADTTDE